RLVGHSDRHFQLVEKARGRDCRTAAMRTDIYLEICEVGDGLDVASGQQVKFFIVKLGDIVRTGVGRGDQLLFPRVIEHIDRQNRQIDAVEILEIEQVLQRTFSDNR